MSPPTRLAGTLERHVQEAREKYLRSEEKFWQIVRAQQHLSERIERCEKDVEYYGEQLRRRQYCTTQERVRLEDKYNMVLRHKDYLEEQHQRGLGRRHSAQATLDRHQQEYQNLRDCFEDQEEGKMAREAHEREYERRQFFDAQQRSRRSSPKTESPSSQQRRFYRFETEPRGSRTRRPSWQKRSCTDRPYEEKKSFRADSQTPPPSSQSQNHPPRSSDRPAPQTRKPSEQTVSSWRKYVDDCFKDYANIKEFPHPPVPGRHDDAAAWEKDLKALFRSIEGLDLRKESFKWHPDKFSPCDASKKEKFQQYAQAVFVVLNKMVREEK